MEAAEEKKKVGRPSVGDRKRTTLNLFVEASQEDWLNRMKAETGMSWGEIVEYLIRRRTGNAS